MRSKNGFVKVVVILALVSLFAATAIAGCAAPEPAPPEKPTPAPKVTLTIGHITHLTGPYGATMAASVDVYDDIIKWANENDYVPGAEVKQVWVDAGSDVSKVLPGFKKLLAESPRPVVFSDRLTPGGMALKEACATEKVALSEGGIAVPLLVPPGWVFCYMAPYFNQVGAYVDWFMENWKEDRAPRFAWLTWDSAAGRAPITPEVEAYIESKGVEMVGAEFIPMVPADTSTQLLRLKNAEVDFTYGGIFPGALAIVCKDLDKLGMQDAFTMGMWSVTDLTELNEYVGPLANGIITTPIHNFGGPAAWKDAAPVFYENYTKYERSEVRYAPYAAFGSEAAIVLEAMRLAAEAVGPENVDGPAVYAALEGLKDFDGWGIIRPVTFSETRRWGMDSCWIATIEDGKWIQLDTVTTPDLLPGGKDVPE